jgi:hypothetical protein
MGYEDIDQPIPPVGAETVQLRGQVDDSLAGRVDIDLNGSHRSILPLPETPRREAEAHRFR